MPRYISEIQNDEAPDSFTLAAIYSRSSRCERRPRRSCVAAETGRGTAFALGFPIGGSLRCPCSIGNEIQPAAAAQTEALLSGHGTLVPTHGARVTCFPMNALPFFPPDAGRTISTLRVDDIRLCRTISWPAAWTIFASRGSQTMKPRNLFGFGASFTLAAIYSRGTCRPTTIDVLMFHFRVRNGTGWGHQAMTTRFQEAAVLLCLSGNHFCGGFLFLSGRLTSAWLACFL